MLVEGNLISARLTNVNFSASLLNEAKLTDADLTDARLFDADLTGTDLSGADLTGADFTRAILNAANLSHANLTRAILRNADITDINFTGAIFNQTVMPDGSIRSDQTKTIDTRRCSPCRKRTSICPDSVQLPPRPGTSYFWEKPLAGRARSLGRYPLCFGDMATNGRRGDADRTSLV